MTNVETSYFFPPQWNYHVGGPIALGNIISNPREPQNAINDEGKEPLPKLSIGDTKPDFEAVITAQTVISAGIGSSLLQLLGISADVDFERQKIHQFTIKAKKLHVQEINPKPLYVEKCFLHSDVADYLARYKAKRLYMIIGIMAVTSATVATDIGKERRFEAKLGASFVAAGTPLDANVHGSARNNKGAKASFGESDFILAYKLREISYLKEKKTIGKMTDVKKGTVLDDKYRGGEMSDQVPDGEGEMVLKFVSLEEEAVSASDFEFVGLRGEVSSGANSDKGAEVVEFVLPTYEDELDEDDND